MHDLRRHIRPMTLAFGLLASTMGFVGGLAQTPVGTTIRNEAVGRFQYKSGEPDSIQSNAAEVVVTQAVPMVTLDVVASRTVVRRNEILQFTLRYRNMGNGPAVAMSAADSLPSQVNFVYATRNGQFDGTRVTWTSLGSLMPGDEDSVVVSVRVRGDLMPLDSIILNRGSIRAANVSTIFDSASVIIRFDISPGSPKIEAFKTVDLASARPGMTLQYGVQISNTGTGAASGVTIVDSLPPHTTFLAATSGGSLEGGAVVWRPDTLWASASYAAGVTVRINADCPNGYLDNLAYVHADGLSTKVAGPARTLVSTSTAADISINLSSDQVPANGVDSVQVCVTVRDGSGRLVGDGIPVMLTTSAGLFPDQQDSTLLFTAGGVACTMVKSPVAAGRTITASIVGTTTGANGSPITGSALVTFYASAISGIVVSATGEAPVSGAVAHVYDGSSKLVGSDTTKADGVYLIPVDVSGGYSCVVDAVNRLGEHVTTTAHAHVQVPASGSTPPGMMLSTISGSMVDRSSGQVIRMEGVSLQIEQVDQQKTSGGRSLPLQMLTDSRGSYLIDSLGMGIYAINVRTSTHSGSRVIPDTLMNAFIIDANIGLDAIPAFEITKTANKRIAEIGEAVTYVLEVRNAGTTSPISRVRIIDQLPKAFVYATGSGRIHDTLICNPKGTRHLEWSLPDTLRPGQSLRLSYMVTLGAAALESDGINRAYAVGRVGASDSVRTIEASVQITIRPGVFTDRGIVIGKVFNDANENGHQEDGEKGIQGVELWMEDGTRITTGDDGKYSLPEVLSGQHVLRVNSSTLPAGSVLLPHGSEFAGDGISRFVRLTESGIARADFFVRAPNQAALEYHLTADPADPLGLRKLAFYVVRWNAAKKAETVFLQDTLPHGWHFLVDSSVIHPANTSVNATGEPARLFRCALTQRQAGTSDVVRIPVAPDSSIPQPLPSISGSLTLSYPMRRDAIITGTPLSAPMEFVDMLIARTEMVKHQEEKRQAVVLPQIPTPVVVVPPVPPAAPQVHITQGVDNSTVVRPPVRNVDTIVAPPAQMADARSYPQSSGQKKPNVDNYIVKQYSTVDTLAAHASKKLAGEKPQRKTEDSLDIAEETEEEVPILTAPGFERKAEGADSMSSEPRDGKALLLWVMPGLVLAAMLAYLARRYSKQRKAS